MRDGDLIRAVRQGHYERYTTLVERHQAAIHRLCYRVSGNHEDAADLAHEAFVEAYLKLDQLRDPERFGPWLKTLALNLCRMWYRRQRRETCLPLCEEMPEATDGKPDYTPLYAGLSMLSTAHRLALVLHYWEKLSYEEVALFLDVPVGTVMSRLHRARRELKRLMERGEEEEMRMPDDNFGREVEAEIRVLLGMFHEDRQAMERLSVILHRTPDRLAQLIREAEDPQALDDLALLLRRLGQEGMEAALSACFAADAMLSSRASLLLQRFVARGKPGADGLPPARVAWRGIYLLLDRLIAMPEEPATKSRLLLDLMEECPDERTGLLCVNLLLCWPEAALPRLRERFRQTATPVALFRPGDTLYALCRAGTRFAAMLLPALREEAAPGSAVALAGAEALARTLNHEPGRLGRSGWFDLETVSDEVVALDARFRRKWAVPLRKDRDPVVLRELAAAVAPYTGAEDRDTRGRALRALGYLRACEFLAPVLDAARHSDAATRLTALRALGDLGDTGSREAANGLIAVARAGAPAERSAAVEALGSYPADLAQAEITARLHDTDREVQRAAAFALWHVAGEGAVEILQQTLRSPDRQVHDAAARALFAAKQAARDRQRELARRGDFRMEEVVRDGAQPSLFISLEAALSALPEDRAYEEKEITRHIGQVCIDYSSVRRYLIEEGLLTREGGVYTLTESGRAAWRVERHIARHYMHSE